MTNNITTVIAIFLLCSATIASGKERIHNHRPDQVTAPVGMNEVVYIDHALNRQYSSTQWLTKSRLKKINISLENSVIQTNAAGYKKVTSVFRNHTDSDYVIEARTHFFDSSELPIDTVTKWKRVYLPANAIQVYRTISVDQATVFFRTEVRSAK
jgi:transcriptional regulator of met regulon